MLNTTQTRDVARFVRETWLDLKRYCRRRPTQAEVVIATLAYAAGIVNQSNREAQATPLLARSLLFASHGRTKISDGLTDRAAAAIEYIGAAGKLDADQVDHAIFDIAVRDYVRGVDVNDTRISRELERKRIGGGLRGGQVEFRRLAVSAKIMAALHRDCPDIWDGKGRPVVANLRTVADGSNLSLAA
jgi:hypothetical protein